MLCPLKEGRLLHRTQVNLIYGNGATTTNNIGHRMSYLRRKTRLMMKVLHIGLTSHYTEKMLYQDNILSEMNVKAGHEVTYISSTFAYRNGVLVEVGESDQILDNGVRLIRLKYDWIINKFITNKIQKVKKLKYYLMEIQPDVILYHNVNGYELMDVAEYVKNNGILLYLDSHANFMNTAKTFVSKLAYKYIHGYFLYKALPHVKKVLFVGYPEKEYLIEMYHLSESVIEYFPLGGIIMKKEEMEKYRLSFIEKLKFPKDVIICAHSGKMVSGKKTKEILTAFNKVKDSRLRLVIYGFIPEEMKSVLQPLITRDDRVFYLGWKTDEEQHTILGASDLYLQPGTYSATAQVALCDGCALLVNSGYEKAMGDVVFYEDSADGIERVLQLIVKNKDILNIMKARGTEYAQRVLDYQKLAERYLH